MMSVKQLLSAREVVVPRAAVGMIIGKLGSTIRRISQQSGAVIQFDNDEDKESDTRVATIHGLPEQIEKATQLIKTIIERDNLRDSDVGEIGRVPVPANKAGLVIGKGGDSIKRICDETGAYVELLREDQPENPSEKVFIVKGSAEQIEQVKQLIHEKIATAPDAPRSSSSSAPPQVLLNPANYGVHNQPVYSMGFSGSFGGFGAVGQPFMPSVIPSAMPTVYTSNSHPPLINPETGRPDYSLQWIEYYRALGLHEQADAITQRVKERHPQTPI